MRWYHILVLIFCTHHQAGATKQDPFTAQSTPFFVSTRGMHLANILQDFGTNYNIPVIVSTKVNDYFIGNLHPKKPQQLLQQLSQLYNLAWYYDGKAIYVYKMQELTTRLITPKYLPSKNLEHAIQQAGLLCKYNCRLRSINDFNAFEVFGVPVCIQRVCNLVKELDNRAYQNALNRESVNIFPLRYASAADTLYGYRDHQVMIPGVVSVLKSMSQSRNLPAQVEKNMAKPNLFDKDESHSAIIPQFSADSRQNAVVIRDREITMPVYRRLIEKLDRPQIPIEISLVIIDVNAGELKQLGVEWFYNTNIGSVNSPLLKLTQKDKSSSDSFFSSVISNTSDFMLRVNILQQNAQAKVLSQPSIITLNNVQAVLDKNITFYTKLMSDKVAQLATITSGTLMCVTPRVLLEDKDPRVLLQLNIQDGKQQTAAINGTIENLPQVQNAVINTQASLKIGQSLLLGGFVQDSTQTSEHKIPILGDIPVLGMLFRNTHYENQSVVRLFLIKAIPIVSK